MRIRRSSSCSGIDRVFQRLARFTDGGRIGYRHWLDDPGVFLRRARSWKAGSGSAARRPGIGRKFVGRIAHDERAQLPVAAHQIVDGVAVEDGECARGI